jgi:TRAP-type C4-dicarboxylate transport system permease small subunit
MTRLVTWLARATAVLGGLVLVLLIVLTTLSIAGRSLSKLFHTDFAQSAFGGLSNWAINAGVGEINGSYELLEAGVAFAIFSFFPVCQLYAGHATVDVFTSALPQRALMVLRAFWEIVLSVTIVFLTWRLSDGMMRYVNNGETTLFLEFPVWWSYAASLAAATVASITAVYCACARIAEVALSRAILPNDPMGK